MKVLLYLCYVSSVWIIALTGCGAKHYENIPHNNPIRFQAIEDAETDARRDINVVVYLGAGGCVSFFITTYTIGVTILGSFQTKEAVLCLCGSVSTTTALSAAIGYYSRPPNPPIERLIGKTPEYIQLYTDTYKSRIRSKRTQAAIVGSFFGSVALTSCALYVLPNLDIWGGLD